MTDPDIIEDGFGSSWQKCVRSDGCDLQVVRPGKVQCRGEFDAGCEWDAPPPMTDPVALLAKLEAGIRSMAETIDDCALALDIIADSGCDQERNVRNVAAALRLLTEGTDTE